MMVRMALRLLPLALITLLAAGCGSSAFTTTTSPPATTAAATAAPKTVAAAPAKHDFIALADRVCHRTNHRLKPIVKRIVRIAESGQPLAFELSGFRDAYHRIGLVYEDMVGDLQQLQPPPSGRRVVARMIRMLDTIPLYLDRLQAAIDELDAVSFIRAVVKLNHTVVRVGGIASGYGFHVCGVVPTRRSHSGDGPFPAKKPA
jgi:hypothetical protein